MRTRCENLAIAAERKLNLPPPKTTRTRRDGMQEFVGESGFQHEFCGAVIGLQSWQLEELESLTLRFTEEERWLRLYALAGWQLAKKTKKMTNMERAEALWDRLSAYQRATLRAKYMRLAAPE